jgi:hypothetical protein
MTLMLQLMMAHVNTRVVRGAWMLKPAISTAVPPSMTIHALTPVATRLELATTLLLQAVTTARVASTPVLK